MTFSVVARSVDPRSGEPSWGVAVASKFLAVGSVVPAAVAGVGALATQAHANVAVKGLALSLLDDGLDAAAALEHVLADDEGREDRQVGLVDAAGTPATFTGERCYDWAGGRTGDGVAVQGNILVGPEVVDAALAAYEDEVDPDDGEPLGRRLLRALAAGDAAGGDRRGRQSAALFVVREGAGYGGLDDVAVDLRVDDHPRPVEELARLLDLHDLYLTASSAEERLALSADLLDEVEERARSAGHDDFSAWVAAENHEMRVDDATPPAWIDPRVLERLRRGHGTRDADQG